jgi:Na+-transporting methylmalonyl-CoA/oxaloacetate decarboxylase gamma subunit
MRSRIIGIVLIVVSIGIDVWLGAGLASGSRATGIGLGFVLFSLPFLAVGIYLLMSARGEIKEESKADKERNILNAVMTRGKVSVADLAIEGNLTREQVKGYVYDLIGKDLFRGYVNWDQGELVSAEAAQIKDGTCPNCGGRLELAGRGLVRCPYCGTETYLSGPTASGVSVAPPAAAPAPRRHQPRRQAPHRLLPPHRAKTQRLTARCRNPPGLAAPREARVQDLAGLQR